MQKQLPYFGYGKKVVLTLLISVFVWIYGLFYFGLNFKSNSSVYWLMVSRKTRG